MIPTPELVHRLRIATGDTQEAFARRIGVSFPTVNAWERGRSEPHPQRRLELEKLAASLSVRVELTVLVIDDDAVTAELVRAAARGVDAAVTVASAADGWDGLVKCGAMRPELLFLDVMMPGIDGLEVARRLPGIDGLEGTRVVFVTASQSVDVLSQAAALGNTVVGKPLEIDHLTALMQESADRKG